MRASPALLPEMLSVLWPLPDERLCPGTSSSTSAAEVHPLLFSQALAPPS